MPLREPEATSVRPWVQPRAIVKGSPFSSHRGWLRRNESAFQGGTWGGAGRTRGPRGACRETEPSLKGSSGLGLCGWGSGAKLCSACLRGGANGLCSGALPWALAVAASDRCQEGQTSLLAEKEPLRAAGGLQTGRGTHSGFPVPALGSDPTLGSTWVSEGWSG